MFSSIKIKLLKRGKIQKVRLLALLQDFEDRISALEEANGGSASDSSDDEEDDDENGALEEANGGSASDSSDDEEDDDENASKGVEEQLEPSDNLYSISIYISKEGEPVQGATVEINGASRTTGSAGGCTFKDLLPSNYDVNVTVDGETTSQRIVVASDGQTFSINV